MNLHPSSCVLLRLLATTVLAIPAAIGTGIRVHAQPTTCVGDNGGIALSPGFCATVFADKLGHARHLVVTQDGTVYVNTWSGRYFHNDTPPAGGFLIGLRSSKNDGKADTVVRFGPSQAQGNAGGTGIALYNDHLYAETNDRIVRYALPANGIAPTAAPETAPATMRRRTQGTPCGWA